jgi:hypothetical protein
MPVKAHPIYVVVLASNGRECGHHHRTEHSANNCAERIREQVRRWGPTTETVIVYRVTTRRGGHMRYARQG